MVPPVYRDAGGMPITHDSFDMDRTTILKALTIIADFLVTKGVMAHVVTVGGAVNTLLLQSRETTHDVDFFLATPEAPVHREIHEAARHANRQMGGALGAEWFNNTTQVMMGRRVQNALVEDAIRQNAVVFQKVEGGKGLCIYAAPWSYALCGKLNRLCTTNPRPYDLADAISYLHQYLLTNGQQSVKKSTIVDWCKGYGKDVTESVLVQLDNAYHRVHNVRVIDFSG